MIAFAARIAYARFAFPAVAKRFQASFAVFAFSVTAFACRTSATVVHTPGAYAFAVRFQTSAALCA